MDPILIVVISIAVTVAFLGIMLGCYVAGIDVGSNAIRREAALLGYRRDDEWVTLTK